MSIRRLLTVLIAVLLAGLLALIPTRSAFAATFNPGCPGGVGDAAALASAIATANTNGQADTINLVAGCTYLITATLVIEIEDNQLVTIQGNSATVQRDGGFQFGVISITSDSEVIINNLTITRGNNSFGGGIYNAGTLTLNNSFITDNSSSISGGGIYNAATLTLNNTTVNDNASSIFGGGGIYNEATLTVNNSTIQNNTTVGDGGGIFNTDSAELTNTIIIDNNTQSGSGGGISNIGLLRLNNSIIRNNTVAAGYGGGITNSGDTILDNTTVSNNIAQAGANGGAGIANNSGTLTLNNSIVANSDGGVECFYFNGTINASHSLIEDGSCGIVAGTNGNLTGDPGIDLTTLIPQSGSRVIDAGNPASPLGTPPACLATDFTGTTRPIDGDSNGSAICDLGAFEAPAGTTTLPPTRTVTITSTGGSTALSENGTTDTYTIVLDSAPASDVTVTITFSASDVTVNGDTDGTFTTTFTPANWNTAQTITVAAVNDRALEGNHAAALIHSFSGPTDYTGIVATIDGTSTNTLNASITDNESGVIGWAAPTSSQPEGQTNQPVIQLTITSDPTGGTPTLEGAIGLRVTPTLTTAEAVDFNANTGIFPVTALNQSYTVNHLNDALIEGDETYTLTLEVTGLTAGMSLTTAALTHTATITDADSATIGVSVGANVSEAGGTHPVTVTLDTAAGNTLENAYTARLDLLNDTAVYNGTIGDMFFTGPANTATVTFPAGAGDGATQTANVQIVSDRTVEASPASSTGFNTPERFSVQLGTVSGAINAVMVAGDATPSVTIDEDDFAYITLNPTFTVNDVNDLESVTARSTNVQVRIIATGTGTAQVQDAFTVPVGASGIGNLNDATLNVDYTLTTTSVSFPAGALDNAQRPVAFTVNDDVVDEFYGALNSFNQNREFFDIGFHIPAVRASYAGVPILIPDTANDDCNGTGGLPNLPGACRSRSTIIILDNDTANVTVSESAGSTSVTEGGAGDGYTVVLATQPTSNVTVNITFDQSQVIVNGDTDGTSSLIFTPANWNTAQNVSVFAVDDTAFEANPHTSVIQQTITSADLLYNAIDPADVTVSITDNDTISISFTTSSITISETLPNGNFAARLNVVTNGLPGGTLPSSVTVPLTLTLDTAEAADVTLNMPGFIFGAGSVNGAQVPLSAIAVNDRLLEGPETATVSFGTTTGLPVTTSAPVPITITDDESGAITFNTSTSNAPEGTTPHSVGVSLTIAGTGTGDAQLENGVSVGITASPGTATDPADYSRITFSVAFPTGTNSPIPGTVEVAIVDDALVEASDEIFTLGFAPVVGGGVNASGTHTVTINDNDVPNLTITPNTGLFLNETGETTGEFAVALTSQPVNPVTVTLGSATAAGVTTSVPSLTFDNTNWNVAQFVTVRAVDDAIAEADPHTTNVTFTVTGDSAYAGLTVPPLPVSINDNDPAGLVFAPVGGVTVTEDFALLSSASYTVRLASQPTSTVTLTLSFDSTFVAIPDGTPQGIQVNGQGTGTVVLTFTPSNWNIPQTLTVRAYEDFVDETPDPRPFPIVHQPSGDATYAALTGPAIAYTVNVNDGITNAPNAFNLLTPANGTIFGPGTLPGALSTLTWQDPVNAVSFNLTVTRTAPTSGPALTLNNLTRAADADALTCSGTTCTLTLDATAQAALTPGAYSWTVTAFSPLGNTPAAAPFSFIYGSIVTVSPPALPLTEGGADGQPTVVLAGQPTVPVTFTVTTGGSGFTVTPSTVTFDGTNFATPQSLTVVPINDQTVDGTETGTITFTPTSADYFDLSAGTIDVMVNDNDAAGFTATPTDASTSVNESGTTDTVNVVLTAAPLTDVVILVSSGDTTEATVIPAELTFTPANWNQPQAVTINSVDDLLVDGDQTTTLTFSVDDARSDAAFDALTPIIINLDVIDNDSAGFTATPTDASTSVNESGTTDTVNVVLTAAPLTDVVILVSSGDTTEATVIPAELTFTPANWDQPQAVTVTGVNDDIDDGDQTTTLNFSVDVTRSDAAFDALTPIIISLDVIDNDAAGFTATPTDASTSVNESGTTDTVNVVLTAAPLTDVVILVSSGDTTEATVIPAELTFTPANWDQPQLVTVTGVNDDIDDGDQTTMLNFSVDNARSDMDFTALPDQTLSVVTVDNDDPLPVTPEVTPVVTPSVTPPPTAIPAPRPTLPPPPETPLCEAHNFAPGGVVRTGIPDAIRYAVNCRVLYQNGSPVTWNGGELYGLANVGVPLASIQQAIDVFSPPPSNLTSFAPSLFCLRGTGTLIWLAAANAPRVPVAIAGTAVSAFPGFTCATLSAPGTLVLTSP